VDIIYNNNKVSYYTNIKRNIDRYWPYFKQYPLFCICTGFAALFVFLVVVNFYTWLMGITVSTKSFIKIIEHSLRKGYRF
jgi:hypothetical protein